MSKTVEKLAERIKLRFPAENVIYDEKIDEVTLEVAPERLKEVAGYLRDEPELQFRQLIDLCGVDYLAYGDAEWVTFASTEVGFSRGVHRYEPSKDQDQDSPRRFAVVYHLLSLEHNLRLRVRAYCADPDFPVVDSLIDIWPAATWFEREAFDLYGIHFAGHPDLRRLLTDYGFIGHPFRKDFPISGNVEVRYDPDKGRVIYQPVTIESRTLVPKVIRASRKQIEKEQGEAPHNA
jgi:NADH-quinone oxidoreductase subunit C